MHFSAQRPWPTVSSKMGILRVRSSDRAAHLGNHAGHLAGLQFVQAARILAVLIAEGQVVEQILGGQDALGGEHLRHARTHAAHIHHRSVEAGHTQDAKWRMHGGTIPQKMWNFVKFDFKGR